MEKQTKGVKGKAEEVSEDMPTLKDAPSALGGSYIFVYRATGFRKVDREGFNSGIQTMWMDFPADISCATIEGGGSTATIIPKTIRFRTLEDATYDTFRGVKDIPIHNRPKNTGEIYIQRKVGKDGNPSYEMHLVDGVKQSMNATKTDIGNYYMIFMDSLKKNRVLEAFEAPPISMSLPEKQQMVDTLNELNDWIMAETLKQMEMTLEKEAETNKNLSKADSVDSSYRSFNEAINAVTSSPEGQLRMLQTNIALQKQVLESDERAVRNWQKSADATGFDMHGITDEELDWFVRGYHSLVWYEDNCKDLLPLVEEKTGVKAPKCINAWLEEYHPNLLREDKKFDKGLDTTKVAEAVNNLRARRRATPETKAHMAQRASDIAIQKEYLDRVTNLVNKNWATLNKYFYTEKGDLDFVKGCTKEDYNRLCAAVKEFEDKIRDAQHEKEEWLEQINKIGTPKTEEETEALKKAEENLAGVSERIAMYTDLLATLSKIEQLHPENDTMKLDRRGLVSLDSIAQDDFVKMLSEQDRKDVADIEKDLQGETKFDSIPKFLEFSATENGEKLKKIASRYKVNYFNEVDNEDKNNELKAAAIDHLRNSGAFNDYEIVNGEIKVTSRIDIHIKKIQEEYKHNILTRREIGEKAEEKCFYELSDPKFLAKKIRSIRDAIDILREAKGSDFDLYTDPNYQQMITALNICQDAYSNWENSHLDEKAKGKISIREEIRKYMDSEAKDREKNPAAYQDEAEDAPKFSRRTSPATLFAAVDELKNYTSEEKKELKAIIDQETARYNIPEEGQAALANKLKGMDEAGVKIDPHTDTDKVKDLCFIYSEANKNEELKALITLASSKIAMIGAINPDMKKEALENIKENLELMEKKKNDVLAANGIFSLVRLDPKEVAQFADQLGIEIKKSWTGGVKVSDEELSEAWNRYQEKLEEVLEKARGGQLKKIAGEELPSYEELCSISEQLKESEPYSMSEARKDATKDNEDLKCYAAMVRRDMGIASESELSQDRMKAIKDAAFRYLESEKINAIREGDDERIKEIAEIKDRITDYAAEFDSTKLSSAEQRAIRSVLINSTSDKDNEEQSDMIDKYINNKTWNSFLNMVPDLIKDGTITKDNVMEMAELASDIEINGLKDRPVRIRCEYEPEEKSEEWKACFQNKTIRLFEFLDACKKAGDEKVTTIIDNMIEHDRGTQEAAKNLNAFDKDKAKAFNLDRLGENEGQADKVHVEQPIDMSKA